MKTNLKLLEERVMQTADRLRALSAERDDLRNEVLALRERLDDRDGGAAANVEARHGGWRIPDEEVVGTLREIVRELRGR